MAVVETERLILRPWAPGDAARVVEIFSDPQVTEFPWGRPLAASETLEMMAKWIAHWETQGFGFWAALERASGEIVGTVGLALPTFLPEVLPAVEVGWRLHPDWWGQGLATEGAKTSLDFGFEALGLDRVISIIQPGNRRSLQLAEKLGMRVERRTMHPERQIALVVYEITADDWKSSRTEISDIGLSRER